MTDVDSDRLRVARDLPGLLEGLEVAVLTATAEEMAPVLAGVPSAEPLTVAGKQWWTGRFVGPERQVGLAMLVSGYGTVNTAHALTCLLEAARPRLVLQAGIAGAFTGGGLEPGDVAVASSDSYGDLGVLTPQGWLSAETFSEPLAVTGSGLELRNTFLLDPALVGASARLLREAPWSGPAPPRVAVGPFVTSDQITGSRVHADIVEARWRAIAESMEGAAAAHVCALYEVSFLEVRGISNLVVDRDRDSWRVEEAAAVAARAALVLSGRLDDLLGVAGGSVPGVDAHLAAGKESPWTP